MTALALDAAKLALADTYGDPSNVERILREVRRREPLIWVEPEGVRPIWLVTRCEDLKFVETNPDDFLAGPRAVIQRIDQEESNLAMFGSVTGPMNTLPNMDGPTHHKHRLVTQQWFMRSNLITVEPLVRETAKQFVDKMAAIESGECDFASDIAFWYPLRVINSILGLSEEFDARFLELTQTIFGTGDDDITHAETDPVKRLGTAFQGFMELFGPIVADRRANPGDDLATVLATAEIDGNPIGDAETLGYFLVVATAGHDTTSAATAGGLLALMEHPEQLEALRSDPSLIPNAVEEIIRWTAPVKHFVRTAARDVTINGTVIQEGQDVAVMFASTCRDEEHFDNPDAFDIYRKPNNHLAFGTGRHLCLGMHLARMEIAAFLEELLPRIDHIDVAGEPSYLKSVLVSGLKSLPIRFEFQS